MSSGFVLRGAVWAEVKEWECQADGVGSQVRWSDTAHPCNSVDAF